MKKKLILASLALLTSWGAIDLATPSAEAINSCAAVRCASCPEGQRPKLTPPDCCKCVRV